MIRTMLALITSALILIIIRRIRIIYIYIYIYISIYIYLYIYISIYIYIYIYIYIIYNNNNNNNNNNKMVSCSAPAQNNYFACHNAALKVLFWGMLRELQLSDTVPPWYSPAVPNSSTSHPRPKNIAIYQSLQ